jgi:uncharacterized membrane protein
LGDAASDVFMTSQVEFYMPDALEPTKETCLSEQQIEIAGRTLAIASGALMIFPILRKRSFWRCSVAAAGGALLYHGLNPSRGVRFRSSKEDTATVEHFTQTITIDRSAPELFALWRNPDVLARVVKPFGKLTVLSPSHLLWTITTPFGRFADETQLVEELPDELVHWQNAPDSKLRIDEYMRFRRSADGVGTEATLSYDIDFSSLPAGPAFRALASLLDLAAIGVIRRFLHNFKRLAEVAEVTPFEGNEFARNASTNGDRA